ncbi:Uncharacterised protein [Chlamydia trachomatis]|nr:Uncharacterised protein [Chlamydia trachomatis]
MFATLRSLVKPLFFLRQAEGVVARITKEPLLYSASDNNPRITLLSTN